MVGRSGITVDMKKIRQKLSQVEHGYKATLMRSTKAIGEDGVRMMKLMVPRDTGALEDAIQYVITKSPDGLKLEIGVDPDATRTDGYIKRRTVPVIRYAHYMNDDNYNLGKRSLEKAREKSRYRVGNQFLQRTNRNVRDKWRNQIQRDLKNAAMRGKWS